MKRTPLKPMSRKRRQSLEERADVREAVLERDGHTCQFYNYVVDSPLWRMADLNGVPARCSGDLEVHEIIPRSAWPAGWLVVDNCVTLCGGAHHPWVTDNPEKAHRIGLHGFSWERPA